LLYFRLLLLAVGALAKRSELARHLLDLLGEVGQLTSDACYVFLGCDLSGILRPGKPKFDLRLKLDSTMVCRLRGQKQYMRSATSSARLGLFCAVITAFEPSRVTATLTE
jgi:hypothetical protein